MEEAPPVPPFLRFCILIEGIKGFIPNQASESGLSEQFARQSPRGRYHDKKVFQWELIGFLDPTRNYILRRKRSRGGGRRRSSRISKGPLICNRGDKLKRLPPTRFTEAVNPNGNLSTQTDDCRICWISASSPRFRRPLLMGLFRKVLSSVLQRFYYSSFLCSSPLRQQLPAFHAPSWHFLLTQNSHIHARLPENVPRVSSLNNEWLLHETLHHHFQVLSRCCLGRAIRFPSWLMYKQIGNGLKKTNKKYLR